MVAETPPANLSPSPRSLRFLLRLQFAVQGHQVFTSQLMVPRYRLRVGRKAPTYAWNPVSVGWAVC